MSGGRCAGVALVFKTDSCYNVGKIAFVGAAEMERCKAHSLSLDVVRVLATAMVLGVHAGQSAGLDAFTRVGAYGVQLFFILSGYLAEASLAAAFARPAPPQGRYRAYARRRLLRILPLYWLILAVRWLYDLVWYLAQGQTPVQVLAGPCGWRYLRYVFFLQMWLPSEDWSLWNNRNALWTMSAFAFFYLIAPLLHRAFGSFRRGFALLLFCLLAKGFLGRAIEGALAGYPPAAMVSNFSAQTPLMVLYCFLFGFVLYHAVQEGRQLPYGGFCLLLPALFGFARCAYEGAYTVLVLLAVQFSAEALPLFAGPRGAALAGAVRFLSAGSFFVYLAHPMVLGLLPAVQGVPAPLAAGYFALAFVLCAAVCNLLYGLLIRRFEAHFQAL